MRRKKHKIGLFCKTFPNEHNQFEMKEICKFENDIESSGYNEGGDDDSDGYDDSDEDDDDDNDDSSYDDDSNSESYDQ